MVDIRGANVLVVGMARSGVAAVELLVANGAAVRATDSKSAAAIAGLSETLERLGVPFELQAAADLQNSDVIVVSPGVPADLPALEQARKSGIRVIGEVELAGFYLKGPVIGITGSNGKTTTTALVGHIFSECGVPCQVGGNIGTAPASLVAASRDEQWNVLELSSFQLETVYEFRPHIAIALNVTPNHLNRHHTFENYVAAKGRLFLNQTPRDFAVLNAGDPICRSYSNVGRGAPIWFSMQPRSDGVWFDGQNVVAGDEIVLPAAEIPIRGLHNVENVMAAVAASRLAQVPIDHIAAAVRTFKAVEHRLEYVATVRGVDFYNDSKATSVDATSKALATFDRGVWLILGGEDKGAPYTPLRRELSAKARAVMTIGAAAGKIERDLDGAVSVVRSGSLDRAVCEAFHQASPGDTVLLAPACASFDQFESFEHRGRAFKEIVRKLQEEEA